MSCITNKQRRAMYARLRNAGFTPASAKYMVVKASGMPKKKLTRIK